MGRPNRIDSFLHTDTNVTHTYVSTTSHGIHQNLYDLIGEAIIVIVIIVWSSNLSKARIKNILLNFQMRETSSYWSGPHTSAYSSSVLTNNLLRVFEPSGRHLYLLIFFLNWVVLACECVLCECLWVENCRTTNWKDGRNIRGRWEKER